MPINLQNISKKYNGDYALRNINLEIKDGKSTVLIGPSGCGKSTLIRIITGLIEPDSGQLKINDQTLSENNLLKIRRNIGYVIQDGGLFPHLTAGKNVSLTASYLKMPGEKISARINELSDLTKFPKEALNKFPLELSGGQQQRVSLMRALMLDPDILLLDEPLGALDPLIRFDLQNDLKEIFERLGKTVLMVTHDLSEAVFFGYEIVLMKSGEVIQKGLIKDFVQNPAEEFVTKFIKAQRSLNIS